LPLRAAKAAIAVIPELIKTALKHRAPRTAAPKSGPRGRVRRGRTASRLGCAGRDGFASREIELGWCADFDAGRKSSGCRPWPEWSGGESACAGIGDAIVDLCVPYHSLCAENYGSVVFETFACQDGD